MKTTRIHFYFLAAILAILLRSSGLAQLTTLNVGYSAISEERLPAWIAKGTKIFSKTGLIAGASPISQVGGSPGQSLVDYHRHRSQDDAVRAQENV